SKSISPERPRSGQNEVEPPLEQFSHFERWRNHLIDVQDDMRIRLHEASDDLLKNPRRNRLWATDAQFSRRWIGQELDIPYALLELIERRDAALEQRGAVQRGLDAL